MSAFDSAISVPTISTGTSLVVGSKQLADNQQQATPMSAMDSVKELFLDMRDTLQQIAENTFATNELLKDPNAKRETRDEKIGRSETDVPPPAEEKGPGILASLGNTLSNLNPFKDGMSPIMKFLLAGAALIGLRVFGEKLNEPLANLVKMFKEGTIVDNIKKTVENIKKDLEPIILDIKEGFGRFIEGVTKVYGIIKQAYEAVEGYVKSFDTDGIEGLSEEEQKALWEDVRDQIGKAVWSLTGDLVKSLVSVIGLVTIAGVFSRLAPAVGVGSIATAGVGAAGIGLFGAAALAAIAAAGIYSLYDRIQFAMNDELDKTPVPDNIVDKTSNIVSKFLGGEDPEGGLVNALDNSMTMGLIGAVIGGIAGSFFFGIGAIPGAMLGMKIGTMVGAGLGFGFGMIGSDELKKDMPSMKNAYENTDSILSYFKGVKTEKETDEKFQKEQLKIANEALPGAEANLAKNNTMINRKIVKNLKAMKTEAEDNLENLDVNIANRASDGQITEIDNQIFAEKQRLKEIKFGMSSAGNYDQMQINDALGPDGFIADIEENIKFLEQDRKDLIQKYNISQQKELELKKEAMPNKFEDIDSMEGKTFNFTPINNNSNNTNVNKQETNAYTGGLTQDNPHFTALIMAHNKAKTT